MSDSDVREARLDWVGAPRLAPESDAHEALVRFTKLPPEAAIKRFVAQAGPAFGKLDWNDDTMVLRAAPGWTMVASADGAGLRVRFTRITVPTSGADDDIGYRLAGIAADSAAGFPGRARAAIDDLAAGHPDNADIARARADIDRAAGRHRAAARGYRALDASDPAAIDSIRRAGGEARVDARHRSGRGFAQSEGIADVALPLSDDATVTVGTRLVHTAADYVASPRGTRRRIDRADALVEAGAAVTPAPNIRIEAVVSADLVDPRVGASGRFVIGPDERQLQVGWALHLPDYATAEEALLGGYIDRIGIGGALRLSSAVSGLIDAALIRYGLSGEGEVARSTLVRGGVDLLLRRREPSLQLAYRFDAEYVDRLLARTGVPALPIRTRENHTGQLVVSGTAGAVRLTGAGGWTVDRFGGSGPTAALTADAPFADGWRVLAAGGVTSISTAELSGTQLFARMQLARALGRP